MSVPPPIRLHDGRQIGFERAQVMGVLNLTPDSFSDGGRFTDEAAAVAHAEAMVASGASLIDVGGESTRPGSEPVSPTEQKKRILPVIRALSHRGIPVSVDTTSAEVARAALDEGAHIINDISAFRFDEAMLPLIVEREVPAIAMHTLGPPKTMQDNVHYDDALSEIRDALSQTIGRATQAGLAPHQLIIDPGICFGKRLQDNVDILAHLDTFISLGHPVLIGPSRKSFIGELTGRPVEERLMGTAAAAIAIAQGAHIIRLHDVHALADVVKVAQAIAHASRGKS